MSRMSAERKAQVIADAQARTRAARKARGEQQRRLNIAAMHRVGSGVAAGDNPA